jgi:hypothetical protein
MPSSFTMQPGARRAAGLRQRRGERERVLELVEHGHRGGRLARNSRAVAAAAQARITELDETAIVEGRGSGGPTPCFNVSTACGS